MTNTLYSRVNGKTKPLGLCMAGNLLEVRKSQLQNPEREPEMNGRKLSAVLWPTSCPQRCNSVYSSPAAANHILPQRPFSSRGDMQQNVNK